MTTHAYTTSLAWEGSTEAGYRAYPRDHTATATPAEATLALSADRAFRGDPARLNPEQLLVVAASSCQLLSFLAVAARDGVDVLGYQDRAEGFMDDAAQPPRFSRIVLHPAITVVAGTDPDQVVRLAHRAHHECYVANSLTTDVELDVTVIAGI